MRIDSMKFTSKPSKPMAGVITNNMNRLANKNYSLNEIANALEQGQSLIIDWINGAKKVENFVRTRYIGIDIDFIGANYEETARILEEHELDWFLRYKTFSYDTLDDHGQIKTSHRYMLKFDEYLSMTEAMRVYMYVGSILNVDESTIKSLTRLWFGTNHTILDTDKRGNELSKEYILSILPEEQAVIETKATYENTRSFDFTIHDVDMNAFQELVDHEIANWEYDRIRSGIYASCIIILLQTDDQTYIDYFLDSLEPRYKAEWKKSMRHDLENQKIYYISALNMIKEFCKLTPKSVTNIFDILQDVDFKDLGDDEFITTQDLRELENGVNLLVAPAGSGKSTSIIELAMEEPDVYRVMIVPTIAIAEQLEMKYGYYEGFEFLYSNAKKKRNQHDDKVITGLNNKALTIATYDSYIYANIKEAHILYVDECHELISFHDIKGKEDIINLILWELPEIAVFITATPFNLADVFKRKVFFRKNTNKDCTIIIAQDVLSACYEMVTTHEDKKVLVYLNSKAKTSSIVNKLVPMQPNLKIGSISSAKRDDCYTELLEQGETSYDIVFTTKFLNIGFDIHHAFDIVLYADVRLKANDMLQFFNREREKAKFYLLTSRDTTSSVFNVNTGHTWYSSYLPKRLSNYDKRLLDKKHVGGKMNPHLVTSNVFYNYVNLGVEHTQELFKIFYPNFTSSVEYGDEIDPDDEERKVTIDRPDIFYEFFNLHMSGELDRLFNMFMYGNELDFDTHLSSGTIIKAYKLFACLKRNELNVSSKYMKLHENGDEYMLPATTNEYFQLSDRYHIRKFEDSRIRSILNDIANTQELLPQDRDNFINKLNFRGVLFNNRQWNDQNFKRNLDKLNIYFEPKRKRIDGENVRYLENNTLFIDEPLSQDELVDIC